MLLIPFVIKFASGNKIGIFLRDYIVLFVYKEALKKSESKKFIRNMCLYIYL